MNIFSIFTLLGGLAFFLYGMNVMSSGLEKMAGGNLERLLKASTSNPFKSLLLGAGITVAIQSSSAMTVMLVGLVNSGIMEMSQTVGVIMGSNVGTTLTAWILSLAGIESDNIFLMLLKPENFSPIIALIGVIIMMSGKTGRKKSAGSILIGFSVLMYGMELMKNSMSPLADDPNFASILTAFSNPVLGVIFGAVFTGVIQSSAASMGILQSLSMTGGITYGMALPIIMGQNIGTCVTALISSIGVNKNAKRVAIVHISFNVLGTVICLSLFYGLNAIFKFAFVDYAVTPVSIAFCHSVFNVLTTLILLPFSKFLVRLAELMVRDKSSEVKYSVIDERLLRSPSFAVAECHSMAIRMCRLASQNLLDSVNLITYYNPDVASQLVENEKEIDKFEDNIGTMLVKLSSRELSDKDSNDISKMLHIIGDFERIGDHAKNIVDVAEEIHTKDLVFSRHAAEELETISAALSEIIELMVDAYCNDNIELASRIEPLEQVIDDLIAEAKNRHVRRLREGRCTIELGFVLSDILNNFERVSDHCSNIAVCMIQISDSSFDTHDYLNSVKNSGKPEFIEEYRSYSEKYSLVRK